MDGVGGEGRCGGEGRGGVERRGGEGRCGEGRGGEVWRRGEGRCGGGEERCGWEGRGGVEGTEGVEGRGGEEGMGGDNLPRIVFGWQMHTQTYGLCSSTVLRRQCACYNLIPLLLDSGCRRQAGG